MLALRQKQTEMSLGEMMRRWRKVRRLSQLEMSLQVGVSTRHLSYVERGKSHPSQELVLDIAQALQLPLRHRNALLLAAGYAPVFSQMGMQAEEMGMVQEALRRMLQNHEPYPAVVVNAQYDMVEMNTSFARLVRQLAGEEALTRFDNTYRLAFAREGLQPYFESWPLVAHFLLGRLWGEAMATQDANLWALYETLRETVDLPEFDRGQLAEQVGMPVMSFALRGNGRVWRFFSTFTTFGSPLDVTVQELRIESLFPADETTDRLLREAAGA